ncbi:spore-associated protein A [Streptomyces sp. NPDC052179]|uniref:spore-associated protein A n=1 Tax=Streptomyces sp. NPDC052179 TaxID=3155680 RepID=UPI00343BD975
MIKRICAARTGQRLAVLGASGVLAAASIIALPGTATAAASSYNGVCGSGYREIDHLDIKNSLGDTEAVIYLTYSTATGKNCAITQNVGIYSQADLMVYITRDDAGGETVRDVGTYQKYAGPVYISARGVCITWGGYRNYNDRYQPHSHCG